MSTVGYEVTLQVEQAIADDYLAWLRGHVAEMLALPGFLDASVSVVREPAPAAGTVAYCCLYRLRDADALAAYLDQHAPRMRAAGLARFGSRFTASRRILASLDDL